jgi:hypothetical protein
MITSTNSGGPSNISAIVALASARPSLRRSQLGPQPVEVRFPPRLQAHRDQLCPHVGPFRSSPHRTLTER